MAAMFSGKSRTLMVRNSLLSEMLVPLTPLASGLTTFSTSSGERFLSSNTRDLMPGMRSLGRSSGFSPARAPLDSRRMARAARSTAAEQRRRAGTA
jgi:hypothetical protein